VFVKNDRFTLIRPVVKDEPFKANNYQKPKKFDLKICPVKVTDSGWYSCYIVKKFLHDQNIKYYTYLNVIDDRENVNDDYNYDYFYENCLNEIETETAIIEIKTTPTNLLRQIVTTPTTTTTTNTNTDEVKEENDSEVSKLNNDYNYEDQSKFIFVSKQFLNRIYKSKNFI